MAMINNQSNWKGLSSNPNAIHILETNLDKIDWAWLSMNPNAIDILKNNFDKIDWNYLSSNPNAIYILEKNIDKIHFEYLSQNPNIFELDYNYLKKRMDIIREELVMKSLHPFKIIRWLDSGMDIDDI